MKGKPKKTIDPTKPMSRADQIEFIKQQTKLAKKVAIRPHIAQSEVLAALHDLETEDAKPKARVRNKIRLGIRIWFCLVNVFLKIC